MTTVIARTAIALLLLVFAALYRFNALGESSFGGFENDHFVPFAYAKQVQAGEQPLVDFAGLGLQGAWPSLTYEVSAFAQRHLGDGLRSEAIVTVAGVALSAALTFIAASAIVPIGWAAVTTPLGIVVGPTLYNYPKVLVLAAAMLVIVLHARRPGLATVGAAAVLTAIAFLFRHDLAVYVGVGLLIALAAADRRRALAYAASYVVLTAVLLGPSLWYVQRHEGLGTYFRDGLDLTRSEANRTTLRAWPGFTGTAADVADPVAFLGGQENAVAWLHYLARLLPFVVVLAAWRTPDAERPHATPAVLAIAGMSIAAVPWLVRGNVPVRLGDVGPLLSVCLALACHAATRRSGSHHLLYRVVGVAAAAILVAGTALSAATVGEFGGQLREARFIPSPSRVPERTAATWQRLGAMPGSLLADPPDVGPLAASAYLARCTDPSDRVVMITYEPEILPLAGRRFGAGRLSVIPGFSLDERQQRTLVAWWDEQTVPLVMVEYAQVLDPGSPLVPVITRYLVDNYDAAGEVRLTEDRALRVLVRRGVAVRAHERSGLPCVR